MSVALSLWLFAVSLGSAAIGGMLGMGSGLFIVPVLTMFGQIDIRTAIGASIISVIACSCAGAAPYLDEGLTNIRLAIVLEVATTAGAVLGVFLAGLVASQWLFLIFAIVLLISAYQMMTRRKVLRTDVSLRPHGSTLAKLNATYWDRESGRNVFYVVQRLPIGFALMFGAGLVSALLGIGSGVLKIPAMDSALRLPIKVSSATSNFMISVTATASAGAYFLKGYIMPAIAGPVIVGSVLGGILGARILMRISNERIRIAFVIVLCGLAVQMILGAFGIGFVGGGE